MARVRSVGGTRVTALSEGWQLAATPARQIAAPAELALGGLDWSAATAPSTAASSLRAASRWSFDDRVDFDASDWWWRCDFPAEAGAVQAARVLRFGGLASIAEVWLNGTSVLKSDNMFHE